MFEFGVASFDPTADGVLLWTRARRDAEVTWSVATDLDLGEVVARGTARPVDELGTVVADVDGLDPATTYFYGFTADGERSAVGRTRTLPVGGVERVRVAVACCAKFADVPLGVYRAIADDDVDLVLHVGDYVYETDAPRGSGDQAERALTLDDYERRYATVRADPDCQALHLRHPVVAVWDDGDLAELAYTDGAPGHDPADDGSWAARMDAAVAARARWLPSRRYAADRRDDAWGSVRIGDLAELLLLDTRLAGRDRQAGEDGARPLADPNRSLLGDAQRAWLDERLRADDAVWAVPVSSVVVNEIVLPLPAPDDTNDRLPPGYAYLDGKVMHDDQWDGYPAERDHLARQLVARHARGRAALLLSGDVHASWAFEGPADPDTGEPATVEFTVPAVSSPTMEQTVVPGARGLGRIVRRAVQQLPHVRHADLTHRGYGVLELTPARATMTWWHVDPYAREPLGTRRSGAVLAVDADAWPPELRDRSGEASAHRPGLPAPANAVPPRPADLSRLRRAHRRRRRVEGAGLGLLLAGAAVVVRRLLTRRHPDR